ncbi:MAG: HEAT repeat domain-containing protein [Clostridia bacterium]|nr:HEAT repeat domain-containing protein [Clostridia bacterium]
MHYELFAVLCIIVCLLILGAEYLWLSLLAKEQEDHKNKYTAAAKKIESMVEGILYSPTEQSRKNETEALKKLMGDDPHLFEIISAQLCFWEEYGGDDAFENKAEVIDSVYEALDPVKLFSDILKSGNKYKIGYACRRLADYDAYDYLGDIYDLSKSRNRNVAYNAAMALSRLGYAEGVAEYVLRIENDKRYSFRIINELFAGFSADRAELADLIFEKCDSYMKAVVVKAIAPYGIKRFRQLFIDGTVSKNTDMRIACVKALGELADPRDEHLLLTAAKDKDWVVRSSAVKGLQKLATPAAVQGVKDATKDKEWWVRQAAAYSLVDMNVNISEIEDVLSGYDKYASDAVKYALYRAVDLKES